MYTFHLPYTRTPLRPHQGSASNDDDDGVYLVKITTWQLVTKSNSILIRNQPKRHKYKIKLIRKKYS
jgi:hypothetical protein